MEARCLQLNILLFEAAHNLLTTQSPYPPVEQLDVNLTFPRQSGLGWVLEESRTRKYRKQSISEGIPREYIGLNCKVVFLGPGAGGL